MSLAYKRAQLKYQLSRERRQNTKKGFLPVCDLCDKPITKHRPADMHEWLLKRSAIPKKNERHDLIFAPENCSLLHHDPCHMQLGQTKGLRAILAKKFIKRYGKERLHDFIDSINLGTENARMYHNIINEATHNYDY